MKSLFVLAGLATTLVAADRIDLSGVWKFALDPGDAGLAAGPDTWNFPDNINLPGTTAAQGKGTALDIALNLEKPAMQHLHQRHSYIGPACYQREITIPDDWAGKDIRLTLERVLWESRVWIDGQPVGEPHLSLSVPHRYDLGEFLTPGKTHQLTLRIDNRQQIDIGSIGHAYTEETQSIWNGVIGDLKLEALPLVRISHLQPRFHPAKNAIQCRIEITNNSRQTSRATLVLKAHTGQANGEALSATLPLTIPPGTRTQVVDIPIGRTWSLWSESNPAMGTISATLGESSFEIPFAPRSFEAKGKQLRINGQPAFLRGNLECAIFPQTGHPDAAGEQWEKIMRTSRDYGLNHLRFHSWCPPEAAFAAADHHGIYLQVELPNWTFDMGRKPDVDAFFRAEGERIIREYGHHPSFVMFSLGNELKGDLTAMDSLIGELRDLAPDLLFTSTSYAFSPRGELPGPQDDFFISQKTESGWVRGQGFLNNTFPTTDSDYAEGLSCLEIPLVTHEVGQYVVYPNLAELPKYAKTPFRSTALEAIRRDLAAKDLLEKASDFTRDSGKLAALLYKEDIERALRTKGLAGIQLLQLQDFPGQSTATVGLLDAFWDSKGLITPEEFRQFCAPVVPLVRLPKFVWDNSETFTASFELANFSSGPLENASFRVRLTDSNNSLVAETSFDPASYPPGNGLPIGRFDARLDAIRSSTRLDLVIDGPESHNSWPIWVYPAAEKQRETSPVIIHRNLTDDCLADLRAGKSVLFLPPAGVIKKALPARFIPVFWSPLHFPNQPGTLGATIDTAHPLWENFPTETHTNWQWWELTAESTAVDLTGLPHDLDTPFTFIDKFNRNARPAGIFEVRVGPGKLLACTLDVESDPANRIVARQLYRALVARAGSATFSPATTISEEQLKELFGASEFVLTADASHPDYPPALAADRNPDTIWHTPWDGKARLPAALAMDLIEEKILSGLEYHPRRGNPNGRIDRYRIELSRDGATWTSFLPESRFPGGEKSVMIAFPQPIKVRHLRLVALSEKQGHPYVSCSDLIPLYPPPGDTRNLGIVPGFNDSE